MTMPQALNAIARELGHGHALSYVPEDMVSIWTLQAEWLRTGTERNLAQYAAEGRRARPAGPRRSAALVLQDANRELTLTLRELAERQDALHIELAAQRERAARELAERQDALHIELAAQREMAARAEAERDALRRELADPANREALEQSRRADDIATDPGGG